MPKISMAKVATLPAMDAVTAPPIAVSEEFLLAFETLAQAVRRARGAGPQDRATRPAQGTTARDDPGWLTLSQYALLLPLCAGDTARVSDLAADAGIAPSTATRILDALERRAIVRRTRSLEDRRGVTVTLTDGGRRTLIQQDEWMRARKLAFFDELPPEERRLVSDLLVRLAGLIDDLSVGPTG
jgi:DNA-binding MarR family transcriptional regulator